MSKKDEIRPPSHVLAEDPTTDAEGDLICTRCQAKGDALETDECVGGM